MCSLAACARSLSPGSAPTLTVRPGHTPGEPRGSSDTRAHGTRSPAFSLEHAALLYIVKFNTQAGDSCWWQSCFPTPVCTATGFCFCLGSSPLPVLACGLQSTCESAHPCGEPFPGLGWESSLLLPPTRKGQTLRFSTRSTRTQSARWWPQPKEVTAQRCVLMSLTRVTPWLRGASRSLPCRHQARRMFLYTRPK